VYISQLIHYAHIANEGRHFEQIINHLRYHFVKWWLRYVLSFPDNLLWYRKSNTQNPLSCPIIVKSMIEVRRHINIKD
jgi:hypothetical protein